MNNKFFTKNDNKNVNCMFTLEPNFWWSRLYEYPFAMTFADQNNVVLDACCGTYHPFKFALTDVCKEVYAIDTDKLDKEYINDGVAKRFNGNKVSDMYFDKVKFKNESITKTSFEDNFFDTVFCISALEHMDKDNIVGGLKEFKRVLKDDGKIVITLDYPTLKPEDFIEYVKEAELEFDGEMDYSIPEDAIDSTYFGGHLYCYSAVLRKPIVITITEEEFENTMIDEEAKTEPTEGFIAVKVEKKKPKNTPKKK